MDGLALFLADRLLVLDLAEVFVIRREIDRRYGEATDVDDMRALLAFAEAVGVLAERREHATH